MQVLMVLFCFLVFALLIAVASITPQRSKLSAYELQRRREKGDVAAKDELAREQVIDDVISLQRVMISLLLIVFAVTTVAATNWAFGIAVGMLVAVFYGRIAQVSAVHRTATKLYEPYDKAVVGFAQQHPALGRMIRYGGTLAGAHQIASREELQHAIEESGSLLAADEKKLLVSGLNFRDKLVSLVMTPRNVVVGVPKNELVGPLMLDELHKTGHSRFPVYDKDINHVVGILHIRELLSLNDKKSETAEKAMEQKVYYIAEDQTLSAALAAFLKTRHHMFVVVNEYRETVGLLTLEDVVEELLGREIVDEYDVHDDLRKLAVAEAKANNNASHGVDI